MIVVAIKLSDHFTYGRLVRFALPSIAMMIFTSIYSVVDGLFVSNFAGKEALAAVNLVFPLAMALGSIGFMLGTGGAALVAKTMGEGDAERANRLFSFITIAAAVAGAVLIAVGAAALEPVLLLLGAQGSLLEQGLLYGRILLVALPLFIVQNVFLSFFIAAEKPQVGFAVTVAAGVTNIVLDYLFIAVLGWGIAGAAVATAAGQALAAAVSVAFFARSKTSRLRFMRPAVDFRALGTACVNGSSELMTEVAASVVSMLYNYQLMMLAGADGVAAYGVIMYVNFIFTAVFFGFSMGTGPVVSYHYGAQNRTELKGLFRKSFILVGTTGAAMFAASQLLAAPLVSVFVGYDPELAAMTLHGFRIYAVAFLVCGFNIYGSAFFTALNNGKVSALISFMRTLVFETSTVMLLPIDGFDGSSGGNSNGSGYHTYEAIKEAAGDLPSEIADGKCSSGVYRVGAGQDIEAGRYFFEGSMDEEGYFTVFASNGSSGGYDVKSVFTYFGNYFADLEEGDLVVFMGAGDDRMYPADQANFKPEAPYKSGLYHVGTDIPAGAYAITVQDEAAAVADQDSAAYVMNSLNFDGDTIIDTKYVLKGGTQTVTVKDGEWLELFAAVATPAE